MSITPEAIQSLIWKRQSRADCALGMCCRDSAWFSPRWEMFAIPPPVQKTFDAEGEILEHALTKSFRIRNEAIKSLCSSVRRFREAIINAAISYDCLTHLGGILGKPSRP